ncbi:hypothetical protein ACWEOW_10575 [Monashia sp. NPDC004114]
MLLFAGYALAHWVDQRHSIMWTIVSFVAVLGVIIDVIWCYVLPHDGRPPDR